MNEYQGSTLISSINSLNQANNHHHHHGHHHKNVSISLYPALSINSTHLNNKDGNNKCFLLKPIAQVYLQSIITKGIKVSRKNFRMRKFF